MSRNAGLSLSFLDLVTCGFGGVTLVFLILLAVQGKLADPESQSAGRDTFGTAPLVIVVDSEAPLSEEGKPLPGKFWAEPTDDPWGLGGETNQPGVRAGHGPSQAVYVASSAPDGNGDAKITLGPLDPGAKFRVAAYQLGRVARFENQAPSDWSPDGDGRVTLWPGRLAEALAKGAAP